MKDTEKQPETIEKSKLPMAGLYAAAALPFLALAMVLANSFLEFADDRIELTAFLAALGLSLVIISFYMLDLNKRRKKAGLKNFVGTAPYAGAYNTLTEGQALFFNILLFLTGLLASAGAVYVFLN